MAKPEGKGNNEVSIDPKIARKLKKKFGTQFRGGDRRTEGLPYITSFTKDCLERALNLKPPVTRCLSHDPWYPPYTLAEDMARDEFAMLYTNGDTKPFMEMIEGWIRSSYEERAEVGNCASVGIAIVLKAFHIQTGSEFIKRLSFTPERDLMSQYDLSEITKSGELLVLQAKSLSGIPMYQDNLLYCIDRIGLLSPNLQSTRDGANAVYNALDKCWGK